MKWTNIIEALPENGSIVYARIEGKPNLLCKFKNDSFGLGDDDFNVVSWRYAIPLLVPNQEYHCYSPQSTLHIVDHRLAYSSGQLQSLGT